MKKETLPIEYIESKIYIIQGVKIMIDLDLSELYEVPTKRLNEQVKRNLKRFPKDFMFILTDQETSNLRSHFATSRWGGRRTNPYAFTEQGIAMLSSVLNSNKAIDVNIKIMRAFVKMREFLISHNDLNRKLKDLEKKYNYQFDIVFKTIEDLVAEKKVPRKKIIGLSTR